MSSRRDVHEFVAAIYINKWYFIRDKWFCQDKKKAPVGALNPIDSELLLFLRLRLRDDPVIYDSRFCTLRNYNLVVICANETNHTLFRCICIDNMIVSETKDEILRKMDEKKGLTKE